MFALVVLPSSSALHAQPACPSPTLQSDKDVPCDVTICFVNNDTEPPTEVECVTVAPGGTQRTEQPRGATGIAVKTPAGLLPIAPGDCLKSVQIARDCCVDICFDWWKCAIVITKSAAPCGT